MIRVAAKIDVDLTEEDFVGALAYLYYDIGKDAFYSTLIKASYMDVVRITKQAIIKHGRQSLVNMAQNVDKTSAMFTSIQRKLARLFR